MKQLFFILSGLFIYTTLQAINIKGRVIDSSTSEAIEYASIDLLNRDSVFISGTQTNSVGIFELNGQFTKQDYLLKISFMGYANTYVKISNLVNDIDLGDILLEEEAKLLGEITITGQRIIDKIDKQIIFPDRLQVESSVNAFELLSNMNLSRLVIDPVNRTVKAGMEGVQLRINGVKVTVQEVGGLRAKDIAHIEYYDDPGVRFGNEGVGAVVNFIVHKKRESGGSISVDLKDSPNLGFGEDIVVLKANHKKSEFSFLYYLGYRSFDKVWTESEKSFVFPDKTISMEQKGIKSPRDLQSQIFILSYNLAQPEKYILNIGLSYFPYYSKVTEASNINYFNTDKHTYTSQYAHFDNRGPKLDIFFKYYLKNKQQLTFNAVGSYIRTDNDLDYIESENNKLLTDIINKVKGNKYSLITEVVYSREFEKSVFSAGMKHTQGYADNEYTGNNPYISNLKNADSYLFAQLQGKLNDKLSYSVGMGAARVWFKEGEHKATFHTLRPALRISYTVNSAFNLRYRFNVNTSTPSLGQLTSVEQQIDSYRINRGNPDLKSYNNYSNSFDINYNKGIISAGSTLSYSYSDKPFFQTYHTEGDKVIGIPENHRNFHQFSWRGSLNVRLIKDMWSIGGWYELFRGISNTNTARHRYTGIYGRINTNLMYKKFNFTVAFSFRPRDFWGETISYGENFAYAETGYKHKEMKVSLGIIFPFRSYSNTGIKNLSPVAPSKSWTYINDLGNRVYVRYSWNISFGRKYKAGEKTLNNSDQDKGIL